MKPDNIQSVLQDEEASSDEDAALNEFKSKKKNQLQMVNVLQLNKAAKRIGAAIRRYLIRQRFLLQKQQKIKTVLAFRERIHGSMIEFRIGKILKDNAEKNLQKNDLVINAHDFTNNINFKNFIFPRPLLQLIRSEQDVLSFVNFVSFFPSTNLISLD